MPTKIPGVQSEPKYLKLAQSLREQMQTGSLAPGERLPSFPEFKARGIGQNTVERALALLEKESLIERINGRGIFVAQSALPQEKSLRRKGVIGFCGLRQVLVSSSPYWTQFMAGIHDILSERAIQLMLINGEVPDILDKVDGVLVDPSWGKLQEQWLRDKCPCVSILAPMEDIEISCVIADDYAGQRAATQHLLDLGHERIAYIHSMPVSRRTSSRIAGYQAAMQAAGIKPLRTWVRSLRYAPVMDFRETGRASMQEWLREDWEAIKCTALLMPNDEAAIGAIEVLQEAGYRVPADVSVVGFDGTSLCEYSRPRLTSIEVPLREIGQSATEMLLQQIEEGVKEIEHVVLPIRVVVRESTAAPLFNT